MVTYAFNPERLSKNLQIIKQYRPVHFVTSLPVIALVAATGLWLYYNVPFLDKNPILWLLSLVFGGDGVGGSNVLFAGFQWKWYAVIFMPVLFLAFPALARGEEVDFREGTRDWRHGIRRSIMFGLMHIFALIPLAAAIALSIGGLWFTYQYFKGGVERSTIYHSVYNSILLVAFGLIVFWP